MELLKQRCAAATANRPQMGRAETVRAVRELLKLPEKMTFSTDYRRLPPQPVVEGKTLGNRYLLENGRRILGVLHHVAPEGFYQLPGPEKVRTSPAHGTAYDIAGKNIANGQSMRNAIYLALDILKNRNR